MFPSGFSAHSPCRFLTPASSEPQRSINKGPARCSKEPEAPRAAGGRRRQEAEHHLPRPPDRSGRAEPRSSGGGSPLQSRRCFTCNTQPRLDSTTRSRVGWVLRRGQCLKRLFSHIFMSSLPRSSSSQVEETCGKCRFQTFNLERL
ncbi:hypothetical protein AOLI_G00116620 [Acnodon oligacanthus]